MRNLIILLVICMLLGCGTPIISTQTAPPPKLDEYVDLPFNKFKNRIYLDEVKDKYVRIEADFYELQSKQHVGGYPADEWVRIWIRKDNDIFMNVMVPKSESEICFNLTTGEPIIIYAKSVVWHKRSRLGGAKLADEIALNVTRIEKQQSKEIVRLPDLTGWKLINIAQQRNGIELKTYQNDEKLLNVSYKGKRPIGFLKLPVPQGQIMTTYCDKDGDGIFETTLKNNTFCE